MRILIDTNVLISAALNPSSVPAQAYMKAASAPNKGLICQQNIDEMRRIFNKKFPNAISIMETFIALALGGLELIPIPEKENDIEKRIRGISDRPILRAAIAGKADIILTGDKDFLESGVESPKAVSPAEFMKYN